MDWYTVDNDFLTYIRGIEGRIPNENYGPDKFKPFFGALFEVGDLVYISQVSHPRPRHKTLKENKDFIKLYDKSKVIAVVNLNYMFPVPKEYLIEVKYKNIGEFRSFDNEKQKGDYIALLKKEKKELRNKNVACKAQELYKFKYDYPENQISLRCIDFKNLECEALKYKK